jgi:hypothetical protein
LEAGLAERRLEPLRPSQGVPCQENRQRAGVIGGCSVHVSEAG